MTRLGAPVLSLAATAALLSVVAAFGANPTVAEIGMTNEPDGTQFMILSRGSVHAGPVVFKVMNHSTDMVHEFLIVRTDRDPNAFPMEPDEPKVDEAKLMGVKELGDLNPGGAGEMRTMLRSGRYVMFCNQPGHFKAGMLAILAVTP
jgi:uncharacterized cupredoxin-like copper-binding protein